jgi:chromate reductase, NAD(P)H dehydrogenase (quinone)
MTMKLLGISGSLRRGSINSAVLRAAIEFAPAGLTIERFDLAPIPLYDGDVEVAGLPAAVVAFREAIAAADALLIVTPEYNSGIPGVLKNAIDWASRGADQPFDGKPIAIVTASPGRLGGARCQLQLRQCFVPLNGRVMVQPELMIAGANRLIDTEGRLSDEDTRTRLSRVVEALAMWTRTLNPQAGRIDR